MKFTETHVERSFRLQLRTIEGQNKNLLHRQKLKGIHSSSLDRLRTLKVYCIQLIRHHHHHHITTTTTEK